MHSGASFKLYFLIERAELREIDFVWRRDGLATGVTGLKTSLNSICECNTCPVCISITFTPFGFIGCTVPEKSFAKYSNTGYI